eukprot:jgi/Tetstr1/458958/TSEL_004429.t1
MGAKAFTAEEPSRQAGREHPGNLSDNVPDPQYRESEAESTTHWSGSEKDSDDCHSKDEEDAEEGKDGDHGNGDEDKDDDAEEEEEEEGESEDDEDREYEEEEEEEEEEDTRLEELLQRPADIPDHRGRLPLHHAAAREEDSDGELTVLAAVEALLERHPAGATVQDRAGKLPLHLAVPASSGLWDAGVVVALIREHPGGAAVLDRAGYLPLNYAFKEGAEGEVICALLEAHPAAAAEPAFPGNDLLPLHICLEDKSYSGEVVGAVVAAYPDAALARPFNGATVLELCLGNPDYVQAVLDHCPAAAEVQDEQGKIAMHLAAERNQTEVLKALLVAFPDGALQQDHDGNTPLHAACMAEFLPAVELLIQRRPEAASVPNKSDELPLHVAAGYGRSATIAGLLVQAYPGALRKQAAAGWLPLHSAVAMAVAEPCSYEVVRLLLDGHPEGAQTPDRQGRLPLHWAVENQEASAEICLALLARHSHAAYQRDKRRSSPLHLAAFGRCDYAVVAALLEAAPDMASSPNDTSGLPIHCYLMRESLQLDVIRAIVRAHPEALYEPGKDLSGALPLEVAIEKHAARDVLDFLLEMSAGTVAKHMNADGQLPLHMALMRKSLAAVLVPPLLRHFPSAASVKDKHGALPLHYAARLDAADSPQLLADVLACYPGGAQVADEKLKLPLHHAAEKGTAEAVESLVSLWPPGARRPDADGCLPLHFAAAREPAPAAAQMVAALLDCHPDAVQVQSSWGHLPASPHDEVNGLLDGAAHRICSSHLLGCRNAPEFSLHKHVRYGSVLARFAVAHVACLDVRCRDGETLFDGADPEVRRVLRDATCFLGRYQLHRRAPAHRSRTCVVFLASDTAAPSPQTVAIKLMCRQASFLAEMRNRFSRDGGRLDSTHVVGILGAYAELSAREAVADAGGLPAGGSVEWVERLGGALSGGDDGLQEHRFCIVMEAADRSLHDAIENEDFAGQRWHVVRQISADVAEALGHLHSRGMAHMDVKPRNVVRVSGRWRLIDLDLARPLGEPCSDKAPSTGFCSPELARLMVGGEERIELHHAGVADDIWSYGAMLYSLATGRTMWHADHSTDNIGAFALEELAGWSKGHLCDRLSEAKHLCAGSPLLDLLTRMLEADREERARNFPDGFSDVLRHPFFEDMARPLSVFISEQLGPEERTRRRVAEAQNLIRSPTDGFLVFRLRSLGKEDVITSSPDNEWLKDFKQQVQDQLKAELGSTLSLHRYLCEMREHMADLRRRSACPSLAKAPEAKRAQRQADYEQKFAVSEARLAEVEGSEPLRNLGYLLHLTTVLHAIRNFTSHFNASEGSSVEMPLHRRHSRFLLDTCRRFFVCLLHLAAGYPDFVGYTAAEPGAQEGTVSQLRAWAQRCSGLLADQYGDDCNHPMMLDEPLMYSVSSAEDLCDLATCYLLTLIRIAMPLKHLQCSKQLPPPQWRLPGADNLDPFRWLDELHRYLDLVSKASSSRVFTDPAWGVALAQELLDHKHECLPGWAAAAAPAKARCSELLARFAVFLGGTRQLTSAHIIQQVLPGVAKEAGELAAS